MSSPVQISREEAISKILKTIKTTREKISPQLLILMEKYLTKTPMIPVKECGHIRIDRAKNKAFIQDFLNSPAGAHLRDKIRIADGVQNERS